MSLKKKKKRLRKQMNKTGNYQVHEAMAGSSPKPKRIECSNEAPPSSPLIDITQNMEKAEKTPTTGHKKSTSSQRKKPASTRKTSSRKARAAAASGISRLDEIGYNHSVV